MREIKKPCNTCINCDKCKIYVNFKRNKYNVFEFKADSINNFVLLAQMLGLKLKYYCEGDEKNEFCGNKRRNRFGLF